MIAIQWSITSTVVDVIRFGTTSVGTLLVPSGIGLRPCARAGVRYPVRAGGGRRRRYKAAWPVDLKICRRDVKLLNVNTDIKLINVDHVDIS